MQLPGNSRYIHFQEARWQDKVPQRSPYMFIFLACMGLPYLFFYFLAVRPLVAGYGKATSVRCSRFYIYLLEV